MQWQLVNCSHTPVWRKYAVNYARQKDIITTIQWQLQWCSDIYNDENLDTSQLPHTSAGVYRKRLSVTVAAGTGEKSLTVYVPGEETGLSTSYTPRHALHWSTEGQSADNCWSHKWCCVCKRELCCICPLHFAKLTPASSMLFFFFCSYVVFPAGGGGWGPVCKMLCEPHRLWHQAK